MSTAMALDLRTRQMESPFPRETVRLVRADVDAPV